MKENKETGKVVEITVQGTAKVLIQRKKMCNHCPSKGVCNPPPEEGKEFTVQLENPIGAKEGDTVEIGLASKAVLIASFWAYFIPAFFFLVGVAIGFTFLARYITFIGKELLGLISGIIFIIASFLILRIVNNRLRKKKTFELTIIKVI